MQYKTVAGPIGLTIEKKESYAAGVRKYAEIIQQETVGGWRLAMIQEVPVIKKNGCIAAIMGNPTTMISFNMLVFEKDD